MDAAEKEVFVVKQLMVWESIDRPTISIEAETYASMFNFLQPHTTVIADEKPVYYIVNRKQAIERVKAHYRVFHESPIH